MKETQASITAWQDETFGPSPSPWLVVARALSEMEELEDLVNDRDGVNDSHSDAEILEECADVVIVLMRLARDVRGDLLEAVDRKMAINRARKWTLDGNGHGQHVEESERDALVAELCKAAVGICPRSDCAAKGTCASPKACSAGGGH